MKLARMPSDGKTLTARQSLHLYLPVPQIHLHAGLLRHGVDKMPLSADPLAERMREELVVLRQLLQERMVKRTTRRNPARRFRLHQLFEQVKRVVQIGSIRVCRRQSLRARGRRGRRRPTVRTTHALGRLGKIWARKVRIESRIWLSRIFDVWILSLDKRLPRDPILSDGWDVRGKCPTCGLVLVGGLARIWGA